MRAMDAQWLVWLGIALAAGAVEIFTLSLVFAMVAGGALVAAAVAGLTGSLPLAVLAFAASTGLLLVAVRPSLLRLSAQQGPASLTGVAALVGRTAEAVEEVSAHGGRVKLGGEIWSARTHRVGEVLEPGSLVEVVAIDGATAVVIAYNGPALPGGTDAINGPESSA
jgi:membrane protein implicated in regulation of membrane protease activity